MKRLNYLWIFLILAGVSFGVWDNDEPADSTQWNVAAGFIRANNDAIEVVLGVGLSMEGSASPWYQAAAPTTTADGSTALTSSNDGLLWVDSDTRILSAYIDGTGFRGIDAVPAVVTFTAADATPTVILSSLFTTDSGGLTITDFDNGTDGKTIVVLSKGAVVYDVTTAQDSDHNLDGSSANITTASGDITVWRNESGLTWHLVVFNDASVDNAEKDFTTTTYVDAADGTLQTNINNIDSADDMDPVTYAGGETTTFANGLTIKGGFESTSTTSGTVTFGTAFGTAILSVTLAAREDDGTTHSAGVTGAPTVTAFVWSQDANAREGFYWIALGY